MKYWYTENYKTSSEEMKEDLNKWKDNSCSCIRRVNIVQVAIPHKWINRFSVIPIKITAAFICKNLLADPKFHMEIQSAERSTHTKKIITNKNKVGGIHTS